MDQIINGITILEHTQIKEHTTLCIQVGILGFCIAFLSIIVRYIVYKIKHKEDTSFKGVIGKAFLIFYLLGLVILLSASMPFPCFYRATGRYTYKCMIGDDVKAKYIAENFKVVSYEDGVWTLQDKEE